MAKILITVHGRDGSELRRYESSPGVRSETPEPKTKTKSVPIPCVFEGAELSGKERGIHGLDHSKLWRRCELGLTKNNKDVVGVVCPCTGCNPSCGEYEPEITNA